MKVSEVININGQLYPHIRDMTPEEEAEYNAQNQLPTQEEIANCKAKLEATKDKVIDFIEGVITEEEYAPIKTERKDLRERIRELEVENNI